MIDHLCDCGKPVRDAYVCMDCTDQLRTALERILTLAEDLDVAITRQSRLPAGIGRLEPVPPPQPGELPGVAVQPLPWHQPAAEAAYILKSTLQGWVRVLAEVK